MKYIYYINALTQEAEKVMSVKLTDTEQSVLQTYLANMQNGETVVIFGDFSCKIIKATQKYIIFAILQNNSQIGLFSGCLHSRRAMPAWQAVGGVGNPPKPPFCATKWHTQNDEYAEILTNFQKAMAWTWLRSIEND